jgi:2-polyprenyl-3-methyl-5-hydroxy-6-metoxy-1,4-benzoquinol methylase
MAGSLLRRIFGPREQAPPEPPQAPAPASYGGGWELPAEGEARREAVRWAYRIVLLREPESASALDHVAASSESSRHLRDMMLRSEEARAQPGFPAALSMSGDEPPQVVEVDVDPATRERLFDRVQATWHALGQEQPHWSVVTAEEFRPDRIGASLEHFYATGETNVATLARILERNGLDMARLPRCMDFGCGVGRLSAALARRFSEVHAVDVSESHLAVARTELARRGASNVSFHSLRSIDSAAQLPLVDLVYSIIVLQHNPPPVMKALLGHLLDRLDRGGVAVIQMPTYLPRGYRFVAAEYLAGGPAGMEMHALPQAEVFASARARGVEVLEVLEDAWTGFGIGSRSNTFVMRRPS